MRFFKKVNSFEVFYIEKKYSPKTTGSNLTFSIKQ